MNESEAAQILHNESLVLDLLEWVSRAPRSYDDVMQVWQTSCPRLTIWEDTVDAGLVRQTSVAVSITDRGQEFLLLRGRATASTSPSP